MKSILKALATIATKLSFQQGRLTFQQHRAQVNHKKAMGNKHKAEQAMAAADRARGNAAAQPKKARGFLRHARSKTRQANRSLNRRHKFGARHAYWVTEVKTTQRKIHHLEQSQKDREHDLEEWKKKHQIQIHGNKVTGGTARHRLGAFDRAAIAGCASGRRHNYYSQPGHFQVELGITGERPGIDRSDCSSYVTSGHWSCGLDDPNGGGWNDGYTGTLRATLKQIPLSAAQNGDLVIYGGGTGHHVERILDIENGVTAGHGSAPVDKGIIDLFGDGDFTIHQAV